MKKDGKVISWTKILLMVMLGVYFTAICLINLSAPPSFYDSDMVTDMCYSVEAWKDKSIFPDGWIFGNQLYAVSTPVVASVLFGIVADPKLAMGLASIVMTMLVLLSFRWMLLPVLKTAESRLIAMVLFVGTVLFFGDAYAETGGWQLLFTMCSYYACYAMTVFLAFGCFLRAEEQKLSGFLGMFLLTCFLSFGTGIQSIRQTAVMTLPLIGTECLLILLRAVQKKEQNKTGLIVAAVVSISNLAGLMAARILDPEQVEIYGELSINSIGQMPGALYQGLQQALSLIINYDPLGFLMLGILVCISIFAVVKTISRWIKNDLQTPAILAVLLIMSVLAIAAADTLTTMLVRPIYYFMLFPMIGFLVAYCFFESGKQIRIGLVCFVMIFFGVSCVLRLPDAAAHIQNGEEEPAYEISAYLLENGYTTVYGGWNQGADLVIASDWDLTAGFWEYVDAPYFYYKYLCNPQVFCADPAESVYLFYGQENAQRGIEEALTKNIEMTLLRHFPEEDIFLYTASENIMEAFGE